MRLRPGMDADARRRDLLSSSGLPFELSYGVAFFSGFAMEPAAACSKGTHSHELQEGASGILWLLRRAPASGRGQSSAEE